MGPRPTNGDESPPPATFGLIPREYSSGERHRLGTISKEGNPFVRALLVQGAHVAVQQDSEMRRQDQRRAQRKNRAVATVAIAWPLALCQAAGVILGSKHGDRLLEWAPCLPTRESREFA